MKTGMKNRIGNWQNKKSMLIGILVFGSIWGLLESVVAGGLFLHAGPFLRQHHICICPLTGAIFGFFIMALALAIYKKPTMLIGIGIVAALFKLLDIPILHGSMLPAPMTLRFIVNPAISIIMVSLIFSLAAAVLLNKLESNFPLRVGVGALTGFVGTVAFVFTAFYLTHTNPLVVSAPLQLIATHGPVVAALGAITFPLGYLAGMKLQRRTISLPIRKPRLYYIGGGVTVAFCLGISAVALIALMAL